MMTMEKRKESFDCVESVDSPFSALIMKRILFFLFAQFYLSMFPAATIIYSVHYVNLHICTCSRFPVPNLVVCVCVCDKPITNTHRHPIEILVPISTKKIKNQKSKGRKKHPQKIKASAYQQCQAPFFSLQPEVPRRLSLNNSRRHLDSCQRSIAPHVF